METAKAFEIAELARMNGSPLKVFDWVRAATILGERKVQNASAGLQNDLEWTGGIILKDGVPVPPQNTYTYLASVWATPILIIGDEEIPCFVVHPERSEWNASTYWPDEALRALAGKGRI